MGHAWRPWHSYWPSAGTPPAGTAEVACSFAGPSAEESREAAAAWLEFCTRYVLVLATQMRRSSALGKGRKTVDKRILSRRRFLVLSAAAGTGAMVAACAPATPQVVEKIVKETVVVQGTAQVVEKVVKETVQVDEEKVVEKVVTPTRVPGQVPTLRYLTDWYGGARGMLTSQILGWWAEEKADVANVAYEPAPWVVGCASSLPRAWRRTASCGFTDTAERAWLADMTTSSSATPPSISRTTSSSSTRSSTRTAPIRLPHAGCSSAPRSTSTCSSRPGSRCRGNEETATTSGGPGMTTAGLPRTAKLTRADGQRIWGTDPWPQHSTRAWMWIWANGGDYIDPEKKEQTLATNEACFEAMMWMHDLQCKTDAVLPNEDFRSMNESLGVQPAAAGLIGIPAWRKGTGRRPS